MAKSETARQRRGLTVEAFAHRKGVTKALQSFRQRQEKKRVQTASALRQYKKVMKQQGYEPGQGASRKRNTPQNNENIKDRRERTHLFQKAAQRNEKRKEQQDRSQKEKETNEKQRIQKLKQRSYRTKLHCQRTKKGQPVMKNLVEDILLRLEKK